MSQFAFKKDIKFATQVFVLNLVKIFIQKLMLNFMHFQNKLQIAMQGQQKQTQYPE